MIHVESVGIRFELFKQAVTTMYNYVVWSHVTNFPLENQQTYNTQQGATTRLPKLLNMTRRYIIILIMGPILLGRVKTECIFPLLQGLSYAPDSSLVIFPCKSENLQPTLSTSSSPPSTPNPEEFTLYKTAIPLTTASASNNETCTHHPKPYNPESCLLSTLWTWELNELSISIFRDNCTVLGALPSAHYPTYFNITSHELKLPILIGMSRSYEPEIFYGGKRYMYSFIRPKVCRNNFISYDWRCGVWFDCNR
jgi:hypothetical protein